MATEEEVAVLADAHFLLVGKLRDLDLLGAARSAEDVSAIPAMVLNKEISTQETYGKR